jgi:integrase
MTDTHSTLSVPTGKPGKPSKPYPEFPLTAHPAGQWCKKIRGKLHYFGKWDDPDGALRKYLAEKDALHAGRTPRPDPGAVTVKDAVNGFLNLKKQLVDVGELRPRTWEGYKEACDLLVSVFGKLRLLDDLSADDFSSLRDRLARKYGVYRLANSIQVVRSVFKYAFEAGLINTPVRFGPGFKRPSKKSIRLHRAKAGPKLFTREEILRILDAAGVPLRAMILLGINCGFGNHDCGTLPISAVDLERGFLDYPRPKTGIPRRCPLWAETIVALREALARRPEPKKPEHAALFFVTKYGGSWGKDTPDSPVAKEFAKILRALNINGRKGPGFYTLRHVFRTVADASKDQIATDHIMGHARDDMASLYREGISDERLRAVTDYVRAWLFGAASSEIC